MARKKPTKKASKIAPKVKRQAKTASLTVAEILKRLPNQFKKELAVLKKQTTQLTAQLKKAQKKKKMTDLILSKLSQGKKFTATKKAYDQINKMITRLTAELEAAIQSTASLAQKEAAFIVFNKPVKKQMQQKPKKATSAAATAKPKKAQRSSVTTSMDNKPKAVIPAEVTEVMSSPELELAD